MEIRLLLLKMHHHWKITLKAVKAVTDNGGKFERAFVVVDREEGAVEELGGRFELEPLYQITDLKAF